MKKIILFLIALSLGAGVMAQTDPKKKEEMTKLRAEERQKDAASHKVNKDLTHAKVKKAVQDHKAVAANNKKARSHAKTLRNRNVSHPVTKARRQNKVADDNRKDHTK